jgi:CPA2 family monovalent cation:H+ antiporter-2
MLVNPVYLYQNLGTVLALTVLIVVGKSVITTLLGFLFSRPARTALVIAAGLSQIGEFSFILGQAGLALEILNADQYSLLLAGALLSITVNPLMFRLIGPVETWLQRYPAIWRLLDRHGPAPAPIGQTLAGHIVIVGYGRVGQHVVNVAEQLSIPHLVIESHVERVEELNRRGTETLYGHAANSEVLAYAHLERARALVVTVPEEDASELIVAAGHDLAPNLPIIVRAATREGVKRLAQLGAWAVIHPELEGGLEIVRHTLLRLGFGQREVNLYTDTVRRDSYDLEINTDEEQRCLRDLLYAMGEIEVVWQSLSEGSALVGQTLSEANLRARTGASVVAITRHGLLMANPKSLTVFEADDRIGLIGESEQIRAAIALLHE